MLGQEVVGGNANEITAIPLLLLERLEPAGALATIDATGCQKTIAKMIRDKRADYLLAPKDDWPALADEARRFFAAAPDSATERQQTTDGDHEACRPQPIPPQRHNSLSTMSFKRFSP